MSSEVGIDKSAEADIVRSFVERRDAIFAYVLALTRDYSAAEEAFQEAAVAILKEAGKGTAISDFMAWAREIARRRVAEYFRKCVRRSAVERLSASMEEAVSRSMEEADFTPEENLARLRYLRECVDRLPARARELVERRYRDGTSLPGIAAAVAWRIESVKVALCRARKALADCVRGKLRLECAGGEVRRGA